MMMCNMKVLIKSLEKRGYPISRTFPAPGAGGTSSCVPECRPGGGEAVGYRVTAETLYHIDDALLYVAYAVSEIKVLFCAPTGCTSPKKCAPGIFSMHPPNM